MGTESTGGARWWAEVDAAAQDGSRIGQTSAGKALASSTTSSSKVVELSADATHNTPAAGNGKLRKSGSGFFKGLGRRKKSSGSIADDDNRDANSQGADDSMNTAASGAMADEVVPEKKKGVSSLLVGLRRKKSSGNLADVQDTAEATPAERCVLILDNFIKCDPDGVTSVLVLVVCIVTPNERAARPMRRLM